MINFDNLTEVKTANSRTNYDLRYSGKTGKFTLSDEAYREHDMNNHGFNLFKDGNTPVLTIVENEEATIHKGRSDADQKGKTFTANSLASMLNLDEEDARYEFQVEEHNGTTYIMLEDMDADSEEEDEAITAEEVEEPVDTQEGTEEDFDSVEAEVSVDNDWR